jgi:hypothetical protein
MAASILLGLDRCRMGVICLDVCAEAHTSRLAEPLNASAWL